MTSEQKNIQNLETKRLKFYLAAEPLFNRYGFKKTTIEDVCREAGASKRTFYELFKDKTELMAHLMFHVAGEILERWSSERSETFSATEDLECFLLNYITVVSERPILRVLLQNTDLFKFVDAIGKELRLTPLVLALIDIIQRGMDSGEFRKANPELVVWVIYSLMDSIFLLMPEMENLTEGEIEKKEITQEVLTFIRNGIRSLS